MNKLPDDPDVLKQMFDMSQQQQQQGGNSDGQGGPNFSKEENVFEMLSMILSFAKCSVIT